MTFYDWRPSGQATVIPVFFFDPRYTPAFFFDPRYIPTFFLDPHSMLPGLLPHKRDQNAIDRR